MDLLSILDGTPEPPIVALHLSELNTSGEYHLATPMFEFQKELTDQIVSLHYPDILKYCETDDTTESITKSLQICVENCSLVATHPYLLIRHYMPKNLGFRELPAKLAETSGKFSVLRNFINVVIANRSRPGPKNVAVVLNNDSRLFDLTEALLLGCSGPKSIVRYVGNNVKKDSAKSAKASTKDPQTTTIHLIPSDGVTTRKDLSWDAVRFDVFVAVDGSAKANSDFLSRMRHQNRRMGQIPAALVTLVPMFSIEHCLVYYESDKAPKSQRPHLYKLISAIVCLRDQVGNLPPDLYPIYNQNLSYLSHTFLDHALHNDAPSFPAWPLPELCKIPSFSPSDVERSLLTEVVYHYTPYDSSDSATSVSVQKKKKSYYETKRLQSDYVTNPLRNDYNTLSGIHNHHAAPTNRKGEDSILTHLLLSQLNDNYMELAILKEEFDSYKAFNHPEKQKSFGRRLDEIKKALASIMEDVDHAQQRLEVTQRKILKRTSENEELVEKQKRLKSDLTAFGNRPEFQGDELRSKFIERQLKIWDLQNDVKGLVSTLKVKGDEKSYMKKEVANCNEAMTQSETQIQDIKKDVQELLGRVEVSKEQETRAEVTFQKQRQEILDKIKAAEKENEVAKAKFAKILAYLKETSHYKKRKGRGITPNAR
ncbi:hypothetical protein JCM33374_g3738 [Metschnikowia sp. JCM 33374]|nr:hypothetical protein JCM33374_g3738 [Metschnikowia sp. JCM 33374]